MKVLMINCEFPPIGGGGANATKYILSELKLYKDLDIDLITTSAKNKNEIIQVKKNSHVYRLNINKKHIHYWSIREALDFIVKAKKLANRLNKQNKYDLVHAFFTIPSAYVAKYLGIPYITSIRGTDVPGFNERFKLQYFFVKPIIRSIWKNSRFVVANSEGLKDLALKTNKLQSIEIIRNGIDTKEFKPGKKKNKVFKVLCVSRLIKRKGINYLVQAISKINNPNIHLEIIGSGKEKNNLLSLIKKLRLQKRVRIIEYVDHQKIKNHYQTSDIFVLPSLNEGMSNTVLEAMASGLPIITTNTGGSKELIKENGLIIKKKNVKDIERAITSLYNHKKIRDSMSKKSRQLAQRLDWKEVAKEYFRLYKKCVE